MEFATCSHKEMLIVILICGSLTLAKCFSLSCRMESIINDYLWLHCDAECMAWLRVKPETHKGFLVKPKEQSFFDKLF